MRLTAALLFGFLLALAAAQSRIEDLLAARANDDAQFAKDRKRIAELERMVVFLVREANNFDFWHETQFSFVTERLKNGCYMMEEYSHDGTPASILAAVEKVMGGGE